MLVSGSLDNLPPPGPVAHSNSAQVDSLIRQAIEDNNGKITLEQYMDIALYAPDVGYYVSTNRIFGEGGDFVTAPELSPFFSRCLARQIQQVFEQTGHRHVMEFGAGSGVLALEALKELERMQCLPEKYFIFDVSPALRERQYIKIQANAPHLIDRVEWLEALPDKFSGCVIANEVLDAMPVHRVRFNLNRPHQELYVTWKNGHYEWLADVPQNPQITAQMEKISNSIAGMDDGYESEINLRAQDWIRALAKIVETGLVIAIDYGYSRKEYFQPERHEGTLMCHYQHLAHGNALLYPGIQDITSHIDFTDIAESAYEAGFDIAGYTTQAFFLAGCGLESMYNELDAEDMQAFLKATQPIKQLIMPNEMGELFKVIGLSKNIDFPVLGFSALDQTAHL